jgi:hypothetical protein
LVTGGHEPAGISLAGRSPAHRFCDDEATAARLGGPVRSARALCGGTSSPAPSPTSARAAGDRTGLLSSFGLSLPVAGLPGPSARLAGVAAAACFTGVTMLDPLAGRRRTAVAAPPSRITG